MCVVVRMSRQWDRNSQLCWIFSHSVCLLFGLIVGHELWRTICVNMATLCTMKNAAPAVNHSIIRWIKVLSRKIESGVLRLYLTMLLKHSNSKNIMVFVSEEPQKFYSNSCGTCHLPWTLISELKNIFRGN